MNSLERKLQDAPLRFVPPEGWRRPSAQWVILHQGFQPPTDWRPYEGAPSFPAGWNWWEENGTAWHTFFRDRAPAPTRAMGNWFSLAALGLFSIIVSPFALAGAWIFAGGTAGALLLITGIRGVVRTYRRTATGPSDPYDIVRDWAAGRREAFFDRELSLLGASAGDEEREEFVASTYAAWWGGSPSTSTN